MATKRKISEKSLDLSKFDNLFDLNDEESGIFWERGNSIQLAEPLIQRRIKSVGGITHDLPIYLRTMKAYMMKLYSSGIKSGTAANVLLNDVFSELELYNCPSEEFDTCIKQYLICCLQCSCNFPNNLRFSLTSTLAARAFIPKITVLNTLKGGQNLLIEWLKKLQLHEPSKASKAVGDILTELLDGTNRPACEIGIHSLIDFSTTMRFKCVMALWEKLWENIDSKPTSIGKKQALALLEYGTVAYPDLLRNSEETEQCDQKYGDSGCSFFKIKCISNVIKSIGSDDAYVHLDGNSVPLPHVEVLHCPELLPLAIICHTERDHTIYAAALQMFASSANTSIKRWNSISKSQIPASTWTSVINAICACLQSVSATIEVGKAAQHKILSVLNQILETNPFSRNFTAECSGKMSIALVETEIEELKIISIKNGHHTKENDTISEVEAQAAIEFLTEELSFLKALQCDCLPQVLKVLSQGRLRGIAKRTLVKIENILQNPCYGLDPCSILKYLGDLPEELTDMVLRIIQSRCLHERAFLEIAFSTLESAKQESSITSGQHILKSVGYVHLQKLSTFLREAFEVSADIKETLIVNSLIKKLCTFPNLCSLLQPGRISEAITLSIASTTSYTEDKLESDLITLEAILLSLSVLLVNYSDEVIRLREPCQVFLASLQNLKDKVMQKHKGCDLYFSMWLLLLTQIMNLFSPHEMMNLSNLIFPDMLVDSCIMPVAIAMAMRLTDPQRLLFESIGFLQDSTFCLENSNTESIVHYANLICTVVTENSKMIQSLARARITSLKDHSCSVSTTCPGFSEKQQILNNDKKIKGSNMHVQDDNDTDCSDLKLKTSNKEECKELALTIYDDDGAAIDYMRGADLEEQICRKIKDDLERSVSASDSFLACFIPLFTQLVIADHLPEAVRVAALRTLAAYMKSSKAILLDNTVVLEGFIEFCPQSNYQISSINDSDHNYLHQLHTEALLVWMENFTPMVLNPITLVAGLINCLQILTQPLDSKLGHSSSSMRNNSSSDKTDQERESWKNFATLSLQCIQCLLRENRVRDPALYTIALGIPIALQIDTMDQQIQEEASSILRELFVQTPKLFTSTIYQLCIMTNEILSIKRESPSESSVVILLEKLLDSTKRLRLVHAIIKIARSEDVLECKLKEVDRALTDEILRNSNSSFSLATIDALDVTVESAAAIKDAAELGILNTLDSQASNQLKKRLTLGQELFPDTVKTVKKNKRKLQ